MRPTLIKQILNFFFARGKNKSSSPFIIPSLETRAHNKETDKPPSGKKVEIAYTLNLRGVVYFADQVMTEINAGSGLMIANAGPSTPMPRSLHLEDANYIVHTQHLDADEGWLKIPFGFHVETYADEALTLYQTQNGVYYRRRGPTDVRVRVVPNGPAELSAHDRQVLLRVIDAPATYPTNWQSYIEALRQRRGRNSLSDLQVAVDLADFIGATLQYEIHETAHVGALEICAHGAAQCDGASLIWATILRQEFGIVCVTVPGVMSSQDGQNAAVSVVLNRATPHMFGAVYDPTKHIYIAVDPTPHKPTEAKKHQKLSVPRFLDWPSIARAAAGAPPDLEAPKFSWSTTWSIIFSLATATGEWVNELERLANEVVAARAQQGLSVEDEIMFHNLMYAVKLARALPPDPIPRMVSDLSQPSSERSRTKLNYLRLQLLARIAPYGIQHSLLPDIFRKLAETTSEMLARIPAAPMLDVAREFEATLPGPFAREHFARHPSHGTILGQLVRLAQKVQLPRLHEHVPRTSINKLDVFYPTDEPEVDFVVVDDFSHFEHFERQGLPPIYDAARVAADDMFVRVYQDRETIEDTALEPIEPSEPGTEITMILLDLSASMLRSQKGVVRDRLVALWLDELLAQNSQGKIKIIGYRDQPTPPVHIEDRAGAQRQFAEMMVEGEYFKSDGDNQTVLAFKLAIEEANKLGPHCRRVNVRLVTDGEETLNVSDFRSAKEKLREGTELNFTAVTLATGNKELERYLEEASNRNILGQQTFKHLSAEDLAEVLGTDSNPVEDQANPFLPSNYKDLEKLPGYLRQRLTTLF